MPPPDILQPIWTTSYLQVEAGASQPPLPANPDMNHDVETTQLNATAATDTLAAFLDELESKKYKKSERDPNKILQEVYPYRGLSIRKTDSVAYEKANKIEGTPFVFTTTNGLVGIEVEVENIVSDVGPLVAYWSGKPDGSLRNNGMEFVSVPLQVKQVQIALEHLWKGLYSKNKPDFSNRTSIHIHLNCRDLTQNQLYVLCLLYAIFEKHFYSFAGIRRQSSIFCVPLYRTNILKNLRSMVYDCRSNWHKYTGLNLLPLFDQSGQRAFGTIEFRHLYGTNDLTKIYTWIDQILCLRKAALQITVEELEMLISEMNTTSSYLDLYHRVFGKYTLLNDKKDFEECVSNLKREIFDNDYVKTLAKTDNSQYWKLCRSFGIRG